MNCRSFVSDSHTCLHHRKGIVQEATAAIIEATGGGTSRVSCPLLHGDVANHIA